MIVLLQSCLLSWLPVAFRIDFKILLITLNGLRGLPSSNLTDLQCPVFTVVPWDPLMRLCLLFRGVDQFKTVIEPLLLELLDFGVTCRRRSSLLPQLHLFSHFWKQVRLKLSFSDCVCLTIVCFAFYLIWYCFYVLFHLCFIWSCKALCNCILKGAI